MAEWSNASVSKTEVPLREPGVQIPLLPNVINETAAHHPKDRKDYLQESVKPVFF